MSCKYMDDSCGEEKMGCEGCAYYKKSVDLIKEDEEKEEKYRMQGLGRWVKDETAVNRTEIIIIASKELEKEIVSADNIPVKEMYTYPEDIFITLKEIQEYCKSKGYDGTILVIEETPLEGFIYRYGNYRPKCWELIGKTIGYA